MPAAEPADRPASKPADNPAETGADRLAAENAELRRRVEIAESQITVLRADALQRRSEIRSLAEAFPAAMSRHALITAMLRDVRHHPDKGGVTKRAVRKLGRAPRKALRLVRRMFRQRT